MTILRNIRGEPVKVADLPWDKGAELGDLIVGLVRAEKKLRRAKGRVKQEGFAACGGLSDEYMYAKEQLEYNDAAHTLWLYFNPGADRGNIG
jgi:hypothetical protein